MREETGCSLWVLQQTKVVGCCPGCRLFTVIRCFVVAPVDMLAFEVASLQTSHAGMAVGVSREGGGL